MNQYVNWAVLAALWAGVGPLIGVLVGAYLTKRIQRRQWLADNKKDEYRDLLSVISRGYSQFVRLVKASDAWDDSEVNEIKFMVLDTIQDRIFIADELSELRIFSRWQAAVLALEKNHDEGQFTETVGTLLRDLRTAALNDITR
jgi:hypothetical protein